MSDDSTIRDGFIRQRRNLMIISLVLLFAETAQLKLEKLNVFGNELLIGNPVVVNIGLWIAFAYWWLRYLVYFHDLGDIGYWEKHNIRLRELVSHWATKRFADDQEWRNRLVSIVKSNVASALPHNAALQDHLKTSNDWEIKEVLPIGSSSFRTISVQARLALFVTTNDRRKSVMTDGYGVIDIIDRNAMVLNARAALYVLNRSHILTEYYLPIAVAAVPVLFLLYRLAVR